MQASRVFIGEWSLGTTKLFAAFEDGSSVEVQIPKECIFGKT